ncbi:MAG: hypothetical protein ABIR47_14435 [Candidatus Kapaibacterium sp.]
MIAGILLLISIVSSKLTRRFGIPALLLFLVIGMAQRLGITAIADGVRADGGGTAGGGCCRWIADRRERHQGSPASVLCNPSGCRRGFHSINAFVP